MLLCLLCLLSSCMQLSTSNALQHLTTDTPSPKIENTPVPTLALAPGALGPDNFPADVNPLTGLPVKDPAALNRRPIIAKISNAPPLVRPQAGIGDADIVYEHYAEGGLTRFSAIFYGQAPDRVGSIRSARLIDYELMPMYQGLLAYSGASTGVEDKINTSDFADRLYKGVLYGLPYYWRDENIEVPHNLFMNPNALWQLATKDGVNQKPNLHGMTFLTQPPGGNTSIGADIDIRYRATRVLWKYDAQAGVYKRYADGEGHYDANTLKQVTADNVVILYAEHHDTDIVESEFQGNKSYSIEMKLWFEGDAVLLRDGLRYDCRWVRPTREDMISLRAEDGQMLYFKPGNTWFQVVRPADQQNPAEEWVRVD